MTPEQKLGGSLKAEGIDKRMIFAALLLLVIVGALIAYKTTASLAVLEKVQTTGVLKPRFELIQTDGASTLINSLNKTFIYFSTVWIALLFGILISGAVRVFVSPRWLSNFLEGGAIRSQFTAAMAGAPLMLCSCCVAPVFTSVYEKSARLAPSLTLMLAAPSLNPAALILTFILFGGKIGTIRILISGLTVLFTGLIAERFIKLMPLSCTIEENPPPEQQSSIAIAFLKSCLKIAVQTLPLIILGVAISMTIAQWFPSNGFDSTSSIASVGIIMLVAFISVLLALPTFFELPLALMMIASGLPIGAAVAVIIAGPATNLPSLFTIGRSTGWKIPFLVAAAVWAFAVTGGVLANLF